VRRQRERGVTWFPDAEAVCAHNLPGQVDRETGVGDMPESNVACIAARTEGWDRDWTWVGSSREARRLGRTMGHRQRRGGVGYIASVRTSMPVLVW